MHAVEEQSVKRQHRGHSAVDDNAQAVSNRRANFSDRPQLSLESHASA